MNIPILSALAAGVVSLASFFNSNTLIPPSEVEDNRPSTIITTDIQFNQLSPEIKGDIALQRSNHTRRLQVVESLLRRHNASWMTPELQAERARNLDRLRDYWQRGEYPINYEHPGAWEPVFIDLDGNICAVGYLVEQSLGRDVAERINSRYHFATIRQIDAPELKEWIKNSGLTYEEVVAIQLPAVEAIEENPYPINHRPNPVIAEEKLQELQQQSTSATTIQREKVKVFSIAQQPLKVITAPMPAPAEITPVEVIPPTQPETATPARTIAPIAAPGIE